MGLFSKRSNIHEDIQKAESEAISSIIDKSMTITGDISFQGKTRIDGTINGNISGEHLVLSESGRITGEITAISFNCFGTFEGNIKASIITARKDSAIHGKLEAGSLTVEPGASIDGEIKAATRELIEEAGKNQSPSKPAATPATMDKKD